MVERSSGASKGGGRDVCREKDSEREEEQDKER